MSAEVDAFLESRGITPLIPESVGEGWLGIVRELVDDLIALGWDRDLHQIKEKFGGLRFYIGFGTQAMFDRIEEAERRAVFVCEECGAPGHTRRNRSWVLTLCDDCDGKVGRVTR